MLTNHTLDCVMMVTGMYSFGAVLWVGRKVKEEEKELKYEADQKIRYAAFNMRTLEESPRYDTWEEAQNYKGRIERKEGSGLTFGDFGDREYKGDVLVAEWQPAGWVA